MVHRNDQPGRTETLKSKGVVSLSVWAFLIGSAAAAADSAVHVSCKDDEPNSEIETVTFNPAAIAVLTGRVGAGLSMDLSKAIQVGAVPHQSDHLQRFVRCTKNVASQKDMLIRSDMTVFNLGKQPESIVHAAPDRAQRPVTIPERGGLLPRADLLVSVPEAYAQTVREIALQEGVDSNLILAVMHTENAAFDPAAISSAGAIGLMQVMPETGKAFGANDLTDPSQNIRAGTRFLKTLSEKYQNPVLVAAAYNAGESQIDVHHSLPLIRETVDYVTRFVGLYTGSSVAATRVARVRRSPEKLTRSSSSMLVYPTDSGTRRVRQIAEEASSPSERKSIKEERQ